MVLPPDRHSRKGFEKVGFEKRLCSVFQKHLGFFKIWTWFGQSFPHYLIAVFITGYPWMAHGAHGWPMSNIFESDVCAIGCSKVKVFADFDWGQFKDSEKMEKLKLLGQIGESILS